MLSFNIQITGLDEAVSYLKNYKEMLQDLTSEYNQIGDWWVAFEQNDVWESEGGAIDEDWPELSDKYAAWKSKHYPGRGLLEETGTLRSSFSYTSSSEMLILMNGTDYGVYLNFGTSKMPARVFMKIGQEQQDIMRNIIIDSLNLRALDL